MAQNVRLDRLRPVIKEAIPTLKLPPFVPVASHLYRQHVSYRGAVNWKFELPEEDTVTDYERLEVRMLSRRLHLARHHAAETRADLLGICSMSEMPFSGQKQLYCSTNDTLVSLWGSEPFSSRH